MKNVLFYGSGAVNLSLMGWLADPKVNFTVLARPASADALREFGVEVKCDLAFIYCASACDNRHC